MHEAGWRGLVKYKVKARMHEYVDQRYAGNKEGRTRGWEVDWLIAKTTYGCVRSFTSFRLRPPSLGGDALPGGEPWPVLQ